MTGFFERVSTYARPAIAEQRENRLTEIFAAVLEQVDGLALELAREWSAHESKDASVPISREGGPVRRALNDEELRLRRPVRTQRFTRGGDFVDLELRFGRDDQSEADDIIVWVEIKHGASPHEQQLDNYVRDLAELRPRAGVVVLLAPRSSYPFSNPEPAGAALQRMWQRTAALCTGWTRRSEGVSAFLTGEFVEYLKKENLVDQEVMSPLHFVALAEYQPAMNALKALLEAASGIIEHEWNAPWEVYMRRQQPAYGLGYWEGHETVRSGQRAVDWNPGWWGWDLFASDIELPESRGGVPVFVSGVCADRNDVIIEHEAAAWADELNTQTGFYEFRDRANVRFARTAYPEQVLVGRTLLEQAEGLARWVLTSFQALNTAGPPPSSKRLEGQ